LAEVRLILTEVKGYAVNVLIVSLVRAFYISEEKIKEALAKAIPA